MTTPGCSGEGSIEFPNAGSLIASETVAFRGCLHRTLAPNVTKPSISSNTVVHKLLECPVCMSMMYPPIHQCSNGHTLCSKCSIKVRYCPICRQELGNIRCLALEQVAESLELPCEYQIFGCQDIFTYCCRLRHQQNCKFRPYHCPYTGSGSECHVTGDIHFLLAHLKSHHKVDMQDGHTFNHRYAISYPRPRDVDNVTWMLTVFNCYGHQFCLHFDAVRLGMALVYVAFIRFMGDNEDASKFAYSLEVAGNGRKMVWQGIPRSIRDSHTTVCDSMDTLIIHRRMALFLSGCSERGERKLKVAGRIWKDNKALEK